MVRLPCSPGCLALLSLLVPFAPGAHAQTTTTLAGTAHDFSEMAGSEEEGCAMCHLPFGTSGNKGGAENEPEAYASVLTVDGVEGMGMETALCLSCHDGVSGPSVGSYQLGTSHPASVAYDPDGNPGLRSVQEVEERGLALAVVDGEVRVECTSCHTSHDNTNGAFLRISNEGSALCLTCHIK
ncbi:MAG: cytochrome c3 family protein [Gemmatimonadales bacterium]|nr:MAG: cytochrome c3 family protein [Gemmatimonadales bacterium]